MTHRSTRREVYLKTGRKVVQIQIMWGRAPSPTAVGVDLGVEDVVPKDG